jgi:hypothetical protein
MTPTKQMGLFPKERESVSKAKERHIDTNDEEIIYVNSEDFKYDRSDLFDNTPVFKYPVMNYNSGGE